MERSLSRSRVRIAMGGRTPGLRISGVYYIRSRYGAEPWIIEDTDVEWPAECPDCGARLGEFHFTSCGIEVCPRCHLPLQGCGCAAT